MRRRDLPTAVHATAPLRLDFAGGWTDVAPFSAREGGVVVNGAIGLRAHVELHLGGKLLRLVSEELGETLECANSGGLVPHGKLSLLTAALRRFPVLGGFTLTTRCDAPPGSGLGSSPRTSIRTPRTRLFIAWTPRAWYSQTTGSCAAKTPCAAIGSRGIGMPVRFPSGRR